VKNKKIKKRPQGKNIIPQRGDDTDWYCTPSFVNRINERSADTEDAEDPQRSQS
jgi:hypothetical protein